MMRHVIEGEANEKPVRLGSSIYPGSLNHKTCQSHSLILYQMVEFFRFIIHKTAHCILKNRFIFLNDDKIVCYNSEGALLISKTLKNKVQRSAH